MHEHGSGESLGHGLQSGAVPEGDSKPDGIPALQKPCIGSGELHPNAAQINKELYNMMRSPFRRMLADYLGCAPNADAVKAFANKSPDRWMQGLQMLAQLSGFTKEVKVINEFHVASASDGQLNERLQEVRKRVAQLQSERAIRPDVSRGTKDRGAESVNVKVKGSKSVNVKGFGNSSPTPQSPQGNGESSSRLNAGDDVLDVPFTEVSGPDLT